MNPLSGSPVVTATGAAATLMRLATIVTDVMPARLDPLFPECCYGCAHHEPSGACGHDFSQLLRQEFAVDPNRPCPVSTASE